MTEATNPSNFGPEHQANQSEAHERGEETMAITREVQVDQEVADKFWEIYDAAFTPLRIMSPCRQFLNREEFHEEMQDERILKFVLWEKEKPVVMSLVATDLEAVPWISPDYFAHKFPEHFQKKTIYYFGALLVEPGSQGLKYSAKLLNALENFVFENKGIAAFDCMQANDTFLPKIIKETGEIQGNFEIHKLDTQHYYAYEATGFKPGYGPGIMP